MTDETQIAAIVESGLADMIGRPVTSETVDIVTQRVMARMLILDQLLPHPLNGDA